VLLGAEQAAGFTYAIDWGDGSPAQTISGSGTAVTVDHVYSGPGPDTIQVTATDKDGGTSAAATQVVALSAVTSGSLQALLDGTSAVSFQAPSDSLLQAILTAIDGLSAPPAPVTIAVTLGSGTYSDIVASPPANVTLVVNGGSTTTVVGNSPALHVTRGTVLVNDVTLTTATLSPTVLVSGGSLRLRNTHIQESTGFPMAATTST
jgi:hypothetical protein